MSQEDDIKPINVADELSKSFLDYSMSVIISRALPDARDGLKPSQRRILFAMNDLGLAPNKAHRKCAKICGDTSGNYHPHGEAVIYPTLVNMAQDWSMREILVDGQGNFGSPEADPPAAMRYTEARLTHLGMAMMSDLDKRTVDFVPNYDETRTEPTVFPAAFPNLLVNGGTGIAVGMATNIPPHNLGEIVDAICAQIDNPEITLPELMQHVKGPDFPVACEIRGVKGIESYFATGRGSVKMRGKMEVDEKESGASIITITEVPYGVNRATLATADRGAAPRESPPGDRRHAGPDGREDAHRDHPQARRPPPGDRQPDLQTHLDGDLVQREHAGDPRAAAEAPLAQGGPRLLHRAPARGGHPAHAVPPGEGGRPGREPGGPSPRPGPARRFHRDDPRIEEPRRSPREGQGLHLHNRGGRGARRASSAISRAWWTGTTSSPTAR